MRLRQREALRPPHRYGEGPLTIRSHPPDASNNDNNDVTKSGEAKTSQPKPPRSRIMPATARPTFGPPPYIDYDPNSPPAAFPTIDSLRPATGDWHNNAEQNKPERINSQGVGVRAIDEDRVSISGYSDGSGVDDSRFSDEMESRGDECDKVDEPEFDMAEYKIIYAPEIGWEDLSPTLQTEIARNLSHAYTPPRIATLLQLDLDELKSIFEHSNMRKVQLEEENRKLAEMRDKQLRALLRIDNSVLKRSRVPGQLVFRNVSKQYMKSPLTRTDSDYFMAKASELLTARRYLRRMGLNPRFAGEWKNDMAAIQRSARDYEDEDLTWTLDPDDMDEQEAVTQIGSSLPDSTPPTSPQKSAPVSPEIRFINHFGGPNGTACEVPVYSNPEQIPSTPLNAAQHILGRRKSHQKRDKHSEVPSSPSKTDNPIIRLSVGPEGAAQIQNLPALVLPEPSTTSRALHSSPPLPAGLDMARGGRPQPGELSFPGLASRKRRHSSSAICETSSRSPEKDPELPVKRVLGTRLWYDSGVMNRRSWDTTAPPNNFVERLRAARAEKRSEANHTDAEILESQAPQMGHALPIRSRPSTHISNGSAAAGGETQSEFSDVSTNIFNTLVAGGADPNMANVPVEDEEEHGPPYSPISSRAISEPNTELGKSSTEHSHDAEPMNIDYMLLDGDGEEPKFWDNTDAEEVYCTPEDPGQASPPTEQREEGILEHCLDASLSMNSEPEHESTKCQEEKIHECEASQNGEVNHEPTPNYPVDAPKRVEQDDGTASHENMPINPPTAEQEVNQADESVSGSCESTENDMRSVSGTPEEGQPKKKRDRKPKPPRESTPRRSERINGTPGRILRPRPSESDGTK